MTKLMGSECIAILMELNMRVSGKTTSNMEMELKLGQMVLSIKASTSRARSKVKVSSLGPMDPLTREPSTRITSRATENTIRLMAVFIPAPG